MEKIGVIFDTTSTLTVDEAKKKNVGLIPLNIIINGKEHKSTFEINNKDIYKAMEDKDVDIKTSLPLGIDVEKVFNEMFKKYDQVVFIGLSKKLSGTIDSIKNFIKDKEYKDRVFIYDSQLSAPWTYMLVDEIIDIVKKENNIDDVFKKIDKVKPWLVGYMSPESTYWFYKGGRITKVQYLISNLVKINPILTVEDGEINKKTVIKARNVEQAVSKMCDLIKHKVDKLRDKKIPFKFLTLKSGNKFANEMVIKNIKKFFNVEGKDIIETELSTEQTVHLGPNAFGVSIFVKLKDI
jgi:DegV family protein with EDD domain